MIGAIIGSLVCGLIGGLLFSLVGGARTAETDEEIKRSKVLFIIGFVWSAIAMFVTWVIRK